MRRILAVIAAALVAGCAAPPLHPSLRDAKLPPFIPAAVFAADRSYAGEYRISPDGRKLLWVEWVGDDYGLAVRTIGSNEKVQYQIRPFVSYSDVPFQFTWLGDSRHIAWHHDDDGAENYRILVADTTRPEVPPRELTPWPGSKSVLRYSGGARTPHAHFTSNRRDPRVFDFWRVNYATGETTLLEQNPGDVIDWIIDGGDGTVGGRMRITREAKILELADRKAGGWREVRRWDPFSMSWVRALNQRARSVLMVSDAGRDNTALVVRDLNAGTEREVFAREGVDIGRVFFAFGTPARTWAVQTDPGLPETRILNPELARTFDTLLEAHLGERPTGFVFSSVDNAMARFTVQAFTARGAHELLFDRAARTFTVLRAPREGREGIARTGSHVIKARDGRSIPVYVTRPPGVTGKVPLVVSIHGGPWLRDRWASADIQPTVRTQWYGGSFEQRLANRGYATVAVNYRASTGYGLAHMMAGARELADKTQADVEDAVDWMIREGNADPARVAVSGGSFGGFSVYWQLIRSERYTCAVSAVGIANLPRMRERRPPYWGGITEMWYERFYGSMSTERDLLQRSSPVTHVERIRVPMLIVHGVNDVRVPVEDSDDMVRLLRAQGTPVEYHRIEGEGHSIRASRHRLALIRAYDRFFARCLGGRAE